MVNVRIKLLATLRNITECNEIEIEAKNVKQAISKLTEIYGTDMEEELLEQGELKETVTVLVNGRNITYLEGIETILEADDTITIFPRIAGG